jgi:hypothetical protein
VSPLIAAGIAVPVLGPPQAAKPQTVSSSPAEPRPVEPRSVAPVMVAPDVALEKAERRVVRRLDAIAQRTHFAVSVLDEVTGETFDHGSGRFATASLVKVHLAALALWRADRSGIALTDLQRNDISAMMTRSDNAAAVRTYLAIGGPLDIERRLAKAFDETRIELGDLSRWGSTTTRPRDVVAVLRQVLSTDDPAARRFALLQESMKHPIPNQRWGITALGDPDSEIQVKVGWVQSSTGWVVNSSGRVLVDGSPVLISVMTDGNPTLDSGIAATEAVASSVRAIVRAEREHAEAISRTVRRLGRCLASGQPTSAC